jgi:hypothetical protein
MDPQIITFGEFEISRDAGGRVWVSKDDGESMSLSDEEESVILEFLKDFWREYF